MPVYACRISAFDHGEHCSTMVLPVEEDAWFSKACLRPLEARKYNRIVYRSIIRIKLIQFNPFVNWSTPHQIILGEKEEGAYCFG